MFLEVNLYCNIFKQQKKNKRYLMRLVKMVFSRYIFVALYVDTTIWLGCVFTFHGLVIRCMCLFSLSPALENYESVSVSCFQSM